MRVFVTGANGLIGRSVVEELVGAGHKVTGLVRSDDAAELISSLGAEVAVGSLGDPDGLAHFAGQSDGVIHLAFDHGLMFGGDMAGAAALDRRAIEAIAGALEGTDRPFLIAGGVLRIDGDGSVQGEEALTVGDEASRELSGAPTDRIANAAYTLALAERGIRSAVVRLAPIVHGDGDGGFLTPLVMIARATGVSGYAGQGTNRWPAAHVNDVARLYRLGLESAPPGTVLHGVGEEGVELRAIAEAIADRAGLEARSIPDEQLVEHFGGFALFIGADCPTSFEKTRTLLGWEPTHVGLLDDIAQGTSFLAAS